MKVCKKKFLIFFKKNHYNNFLILVFLLLNSLNLFFNINSLYVLPITIILIVEYLHLSKIEYNKKKKFILIWLTFSILTFFGESIIIKFNKSLKYNKNDIINVPLWLFSAYANMVYSILFLNNYFKTII